MPSWRDGDGKVTFGDMPRHLVEIGPNSSGPLKEERVRWLEANDLLMIDFFTWKRNQLDKSRSTKRPPARRRWLSGRERAELDAERESEPFQW
jgi:hypothetical protein